MIQNTVTQEDQVITNYHILKEEGYVLAFVAVHNEFPTIPALLFEQDYQLGFVINKAIKTQGDDYQEKSIWIRPEFYNTFQKTILEELLRALHGEQRARIIHQTLQILWSQNFQTEPQETFYKYRFFVISKENQQYSLMIRHDFTTLTIWHSNYKQKIDLMNPDWTVELTILLEQLK